VRFTVVLFPSHSQVILAPPASTAVTNPSDETVATLGVALVHFTWRPVSSAPRESLRTALSRAVSPATIEPGLSTVTEPTGAGLMLRE
jgi:hypothetical protein